MAKRVLTAIALALGLLAFFSPALAQLPSGIEADRLFARAARQVEAEDYAAAVVTLEEYLALQQEHGLETPATFWLWRAHALRQLGQGVEAADSAIRYLALAGPKGEHFAAALAFLEGVATVDQVSSLQEEYGLKIPAAFWFRHGRALQEAARYDQAVEAATQYLVEAGRVGEHYAAALELLDRAEEAAATAAAREAALKRVAEATRIAAAGAPAKDLPFKECKQCPEMMAIPVGSFRMGCVSGLGCQRDFEKPVHRVTISRPFALSRYEVTFDQWDACMAAGGCRGYSPSDDGWGRGNRPVINVSWEDAQAYVSWLSRVTGERYRLPSESEWEYAARAGSETRYSWGNEIGSNRANCFPAGDEWGSCDDSYWGTAPVGSFPPNAFGLHDMHGNVSEWVEDCMTLGYKGAPSDGSAWRARNCEFRLLRGGSYKTDPRFLRSANRWSEALDYRGWDEGFRVARALTP